VKKILLYILPHEKNNHRALLLQPGFLIGFVFLFLLNQSFLKLITIVKPGVLGYSSEITAQTVYNLTNDERKKAGLPLLHYNPVLSESATAKAQDMFANNYWAHNSPQGKTPWDFFRSAGYQYSVAGENLAKDFYDTDSVMKAWMNSPTHKANIVNNKYQEIGIGIVSGILNGVKTTLVVQHFGTPLDITSIKTNTPIEKNYLAQVVPVSSNVLGAAPQPINPASVSKIFGIVLFLIIITILGVDSYITLKNQIHRLAGSASGHVGFLIVILFLLLISQQGRIF
jgi:uncharacterized protein YkwD